MCAVIDEWVSPFAVYTTADTPSAFQWAGQPPKLPIHMGGSQPHLIHGSLYSVFICCTFGPPCTNIYKCVFSSISLCICERHSPTRLPLCYTQLVLLLFQASWQETSKLSGQFFVYMEIKLYCRCNTIRAEGFSMLLSMEYGVEISKNTLSSDDYGCPA